MDDDLKTDLNIQVQAEPVDCGSGLYFIAVYVYGEIDSICLLAEGADLGLDSDADFNSSHV